MKKILIPVDFSEVAINAIRYAFDLYGDHAKFTIFHISNNSLSLYEPELVHMALNKTDLVHIELTNTVEDLIQKNNLKVEFEVQVEIGAIVDSIIRKIDIGNYDGVVMGTKDKYSLFEKLFGTVSLGVVKRTEIPVYLIPFETRFSPFEEVVVAADFHLESDDLIWGISEWNQRFKAHIHFLHVSKKHHFSDAFIRNIVEEYFDEKNVEFPFTIVNEDDDDVAEEIIEYSDEENADLQIIVTDKTTWLDMLTSNSVSKEMILKATKPMLFLHSGKTKKSQLFFELLTV